MHTISSELGRVTSVWLLSTPWPGITNIWWFHSALLMPPLSSRALSTAYYKTFWTLLYLSIWTTFRFSLLIWRSTVAMLQRLLAEKCKFHTTFTTFLGLIAPLRLEMNPDKFQAVSNWPTPRKGRKPSPTSREGLLQLPYLSSPTRSISSWWRLMLLTPALEGSCSRGLYRITNFIPVCSIPVTCPRGTMM